MVPKLAWSVLNAVKLPPSPAQDDGARDMMSALEEVVRLRGEKEARVASLKAEAEELRAMTAAEASRRDRAKLKTAEILAPVPALRQGIWVQSDLLKRLRDEVQASFLSSIF